VSAAICVMPMNDPGDYGLPDGRPLAIVFARALAHDTNLEDEAIRLFGLTPAEAKVASALASGQSLAEAADEQMVRITTARTHLARIFQKTGTRQQSQVAALLRAAHLPVRSRHGTRVGDQHPD
jgi:DNA-binding CsgD family transcriptional regulator